MENPVRSGIVLVLDVIRDWIFYFRFYRPAEREKDPSRRLRKELWMEIAGTRLNGMGANGTPLNFRKKYYDKLPSEEARAGVRKALLSMIRSRDFPVLQKEILASICADLGMDEAEEDISFVREASARCMTISELRRFKRQQEREMKNHKMA